MLELSSFQLETIAEFRAHIGLALNVTQNHLDRHHTFENYAAAKGRLFETQQAGDFADAECRRPGLRRPTRRARAATVAWFSGRAQGEAGRHACAATSWCSTANCS